VCVCVMTVMTNTRKKAEANRRKLERMGEDLNRLKPTKHKGLFRHCNVSRVVQKTPNVYFKDIAKHLITHINKADYIVGCVAWLSYKPILAALARRRGVSIVVQKEDYLNHDVELRGLYDDLVPLNLQIFEDTIDFFDFDIDPVRCAGTCYAGKILPRCHHKFLLFCDDLEPYAVWTGSFNFTYNATRSLENAVVLEDPLVVKAYYREYQRVLLISEPLDWQERSLEPEWSKI